MVRAMDRLKALRVGLGQSLFPASRAAGTRFGKGEAALLFAALLALGIVLQLARIGWTGSLDALWAEDGAILLPAALTESFGHAVGSEYSGYLVLVPRLIGEVASALPLRDAPATFSILSAALVALSGLVVWHASSGHIASPYLRGALALATVLTPVGGQETIDAASYVSWSMLVATFWLLLWRPRSSAGAGAGALFILLTALSNPGVWFFVPLGVLRALAARDRRDWALLGAFFGGAVVQVFAIARSDYDPIEPLWTADIWTVLLQRLVDGTAFGLRLGGIAWAHLGWPFLIVLTALAVAGLALGIRHAARSARCLAAVAVPTALVMFVISVYQRAVASPMLWPAGGHNGAAGRYAIVPVMLLIGVAMALIDSWERRRDAPGRRPWPSLAAATLVLVSVAVSFPAWNTDVRGTPTWSSSLDAAAASCASEHLPDVALPISPPGFGVRLSCAAIPDSSVPTR
jgi:hypothetical protein